MLASDFSHLSYQNLYNSSFIHRKNVFEYFTLNSVFEWLLKVQRTNSFYIPIQNERNILVLLLPNTINTIKPHCIITDLRDSKTKQRWFLWKKCR